MKQGDKIRIQATILRVEGNRLDAQTANGQLIQTHVDNARILDPHVPTENRAILSPPNHKAVLSAPENKSRRK